MLCDECQKRPAKVHITRVVNNQQTKLHLCESCAKKYQKQPFALGLDPGFSVHEFLAGLLDDEGDSIDFPGQVKQRCEKCGLTYSEFGKTGRLGCNQCYETFRHKLEPLLTRIHGNAEHKGKVPQHAGENVRHKREIEQYRYELQKLINQERFEEAAEVRDKIRDLESRFLD